MNVKIDKEGTIVILTGAGISRESGLETFRCKDGIWSKVDLEDVATPEAFMRNPKMVQDFYNARRSQLVDEKPQPNPGHLALAKLERDWPGRVLIVTQNIDNLHELAGSQNIIHMHGELLKIRCNHCGSMHQWEQELHIETPCPECDQSGGLRPHVVWFGEIPLQMEEIYEALEDCDLFMSIGTSGNVYPAAGFVQAVTQMGGCHTVELNLDPSNGATQFAQTLYGPASEVVPRYVDELLKR
ncbi:deacetylase of acetyl-CoA synthetase, NAD-dependent [Candidatus Terasakiella magnetica]|uniref:NAD-dependent protein deacylase n=1 Tax=Candidatus Terasakiella magnetica TaxID=1867952 RepID=A0A1C3RG91_9PROT|nr:Sir2 family NAD+-dependent deacetylase [Candidatus Terasakiella magnetica]SCA56326.1 deacetylase of acetyl-CoA synthetase, NAD-dependent [Candidatus Terasakiella magnetica]